MNAKKHLRNAKAGKRSSKKGKSFTKKIKVSDSKRGRKIISRKK